MAPLTIHLRNKTRQAQSYVLFSDDVHTIGGSSKRVVLIPNVDSRKTTNLVIDSVFYLWAKVRNSSELVFAEAPAGSVLAVEDVGGKPVIRNVVGTPPEPGCVAIATRQNFNGTLGLALKINDLGLCPIAVRRVAGAANYHVELSSSFNIAVNRKYEDGDELRDDSTIPILVHVEFMDGVNDVVVTHHSTVAESLQVGQDNEDKWTEWQEHHRKILRTSTESVLALLESMPDVIPAEILNGLRSGARRLQAPRSLTDYQENNPAATPMSYTERLSRMSKDLETSRHEKHDLTLALEGANAKCAQLAISVEEQTNKAMEARQELAQTKIDTSNALVEVTKAIVKEREAMNAKMSELQAERDALADQVDELITKQVAAEEEKRTHEAPRYNLELNVLDHKGEFPLYIPAAGGRYDEVKQLLERGAHPSMRTSSQWTALHWAVNYGYENVVELLLEHGADVNAVSDTGKRPLMMAKNDRIKQMLMAKGAW